MVEQHNVEIAFPDRTPDVAGRLAEDLSREIRRSVRDNGHPVESNLVRTDATAQDFGTALVLALGTPSIIYLARAVLEWAKRTNNSSIALNGIEIKNLESCDVASVVTALKLPIKRSNHGEE